MLMRIIIT